MFAFYFLYNLGISRVCLQLWRSRNMVNNTFLTLIAEASLSRADENLKEIPQFTEAAALEQNRNKYSEIYLKIV